MKEGDNYRAFVKFKISVEDARRLTQPKDKISREDKFKDLEEPKEQVKRRDVVVEVLPPQ